MAQHHDFMIVYQNGIEEHVRTKLKEKLEAELPQITSHQHHYPLPMEWEGVIPEIACQLRYKKVTNLIVILRDNPSELGWLVPFLKELCKIVNQADCRQFADHHLR